MTQDESQTLDRLSGEPHHDRLAAEERRYTAIAGEDPHFGAGETTDDDDLSASARRERAELWSRIANGFNERAG